MEEENRKYDANNVTLKKVPKAKYTLKRLDDGLTKRGNRVQYIEWNKDKTAEESYDDIQTHRSLILDPGLHFTWLTTPITEILEQKDKYIKFQTENSTYELVQHF
jgi:hypothetical protein